MALLESPPRQNTNSPPICGDRHVSEIDEQHGKVERIASTPLSEGQESGKGKDMRDKAAASLSELQSLASGRGNAILVVVLVMEQNSSHWAFGKPFISESVDIIQVHGILSTSSHCCPRTSCLTNSTVVRVRSCSVQRMAVFC